MSDVKIEMMTGLEAREAKHDDIAWPPDAVVVYGMDERGVAGRTAWIELGHIEGTEVREDKRGTTLAAKLVRRLENMMREFGRSHIFAFVEDDKPEVAGYMERFGYTKFPVTVWAKSLGQPSIPSTQELDWIQRGMDFHDRLFALRPEDTHVDDVQHFQDVGHCLEIAFDEDDPERAMEFYAGCIANGAPYEPIKMVDKTADSVTVDMGTHGVIEIARDGSVREVTCQ